MKQINNTMKQLSHKFKNLKMSTIGPSGAIPICMYEDFNKFTTDTKQRKINEKDSTLLDNLYMKGLTEKWWIKNANDKHTQMIIWTIDRCIKIVASRNNLLKIITDSQYFAFVVVWYPP